MKKTLLFFTLLSFTTVVSAQLKVTTNGKVGIGTNNPAEKLHVVGPSIFNGVVKIDFWTDIIVDWSGYSSSPVIYPENDWYLQLGRPDKQLGNIFANIIYATLHPKFTSDIRAKENIIRLYNVIKIYENTTFSLFIFFCYYPFFCM